MFLLGKSLGTHRFQRAVSARDRLIGISPPPNMRRCSGSYQFVFRRDCTLEAMRTQGAFSLFQGVATRHEGSSGHWPLQSLDDLFGDLTSRAAFSIDRLAKMGIVMRFYAFYNSTRDPLRPRPFNFSPAFHKALFYGRQTGFQTKHPQLGVERLDSCNDFIEIVAAAESHRDDDRP